MTPAETKAYNKGLEAAAKLAGYQVFEVRDEKNRLHTWQVGEAIAKLIRAKKKKVK
jgi:hypothetical protein